VGKIVDDRDLVWKSVRRVPVQVMGGLGVGVDGDLGRKKKRRGQGDEGAEDWELVEPGA
jgi:hypothetical protein